MCISCLLVYSNILPQIYWHLLYLIVVQIQTHGVQLTFTDLRSNNYNGAICPFSHCTMPAGCTLDGSGGRSKNMSTVLFNALAYCISCR